ncbi:2'-5' RNA ligase family protein [Candidatus Odyssella thessalonicensis]|uniref:2'-5' RNA ligase family protein n=1 Tax=Candidatus Odyssella thessalonicensis TaxID=84647 RepID=UPI0002E74F4B|nr:2'-5' RNA ligase family protein [Candidatus Odyssella thessalonicensis]
MSNNHSLAASLVIALNVEDNNSQLTSVLQGTILANYKYPYHRHITVMWLDGLDPLGDQYIKHQLEEIAQNYVQNKAAEFQKYGGWNFVSNVVKQFSGGGLYLSPTDFSKEMLAHLYQQLRIKVKQRGLEANINYHLQKFTPHVTLAEASAVLQAFKNQEEIMLFLNQVNQNIFSLKQPLANQIVLKIQRASAWFQ